MREIKATVPAWLTSSYQGPETLKQGAERAISDVSFYKPYGWDEGKRTFGDMVLIGEAEITLRVVDEHVMVDNKVTALRAEKQRTLAEAQAKATEIEGQIQQLLAITMSPRDEVIKVDEVAL